MTSSTKSLQTETGRIVVLVAPPANVANDCIGALHHLLPIEWLEAQDGAYLAKISDEEYVIVSPEDFRSVQWAYDLIPDQATKWWVELEMYGKACLRRVIRRLAL